MVLTPEFNTMGNVTKTGSRPARIREIASPSRSYKATVMLFMGGGADTFNMLVPLNCRLHKEYLQVRTRVALNTSQLHRIRTDKQACAKFGIHHKLPFRKELYDRKKV